MLSTQQQPAAMIVFADPPLRGRTPTRKRTCSFSLPPVSKHPRTTTSTVSLANAHPAASYFPGTYAHPAPQHRPPRPVTPPILAAHHRSRSRRAISTTPVMAAIQEEDARRTPSPESRPPACASMAAATAAAKAGFTAYPAPIIPPEQQQLILSSRIRPPTPRLSSPLVPIAHRTLTYRPGFPRSKPQSPLYKLALRTAHARTAHGASIRAVGPHLAVDLMRAEQEWQHTRQARSAGLGTSVQFPSTPDDDDDSNNTVDDVQMDTTGIVVGSATELQASWVEVLGLGEDWEKVDEPDSRQEDGRTRLDRSPTPVPMALPSPALRWPCGVTVSV